MSEAAAPANPQNLPQFGVNAQFIKDFSFENPNAPEIFIANGEPTLNLGVNIQSRGLGENAYEVMLMLRLEAQSPNAQGQNRTAFIAELAYGGVFIITGMEQEQLKLALLIEAPRYLFPFARNIMANAIRDGGFPQVLLNPIDFAALYQANLNRVAEPQGNA